MHCKNMTILALEMLKCFTNNQPEIICVKDINLFLFCLVALKRAGWFDCFQWADESA